MSPHSPAAGSSYSEVANTCRASRWPGASGTGGSGQPGAAAGPRGHPRAPPCRPGSHRDACRSGDRPRPGRPCSRRLSPRARRAPGTSPASLMTGMDVGWRLLRRGNPGVRHGRQLFRDERGRGAGDLARDGCCLVSSMIASPEHRWLGGAAVSVRNGGIGTEPLRRAAARPRPGGAAHGGRPDGSSRNSSGPDGRWPAAQSAGRRRGCRIAAGNRRWRNHGSLLRFVMPRCWAPAAARPRHSGRRDGR